MSDLDVYMAGEQVPGTEIGLTYIYVTTALGKVRMTAEEAGVLGSKLTHASALAIETEEAN